MSIIPAIITILAGLSMFILKLRSKIILLIIGCMCLECFCISDVSVTQFKTFNCFCFFISELRNLPKRYAQLKATPILWLLLIVTCGAIITIITSPHIDSLNVLCSFIVVNLIAKYYAISYSFIGVITQNYFNTYIKIIYLCILVITLFGVLNLIFGYSIWFALWGMQEETEMILGSRMRLSSMFTYTFDYGQICVITLFVMLYCINKNILSKKQIIIGIISCSYGIIMCGSRSVLGCAIIGCSVYALIRNPIYKNLRLISITILLIFIISLVIPAINDKIDFLMSAVDSNSSVGGSSSGMRIRQYATVLLIVSKSPWVGMGHQYFFYDLGWSTGLDPSLLPYPELAGLEGALMGILLERGIIGVCVYLIFYFGIVGYAYKLRKYDLDSSATCIAIILSFVAYGNMTGELKSCLPTLLFAGMFLKKAYLSKNNKIKNGCFNNHRKLSNKKIIRKLY